MTVLVTGAGGFIGQNVARYLSKHGIEVIGIYREHVPTRCMYRTFRCDLVKDSLESILIQENIKQIDAVIHFAGQMQGKQICDYLDNTIESTRKLLLLADKIGVASFIYASSISVYGETFSEVNEESDRMNLDDYGMTKYLCERLLEDAEITRRIVLRLPRVLGRNCDLSYPWLPKVTGQMLKNEDVYYTNPDLEYNNLLHVDDLSKFLLYLLKKPDKGFERFVLGASDRMKILDILELLKYSLSSDSKLIEKLAKGRNKCYAIDIRHAEKFGFSSRSVSDIIKNFVKDLSTNVYSGGW